MTVLAAILVIFFGLVGVLLTLLTLPGAWLALGVAALCNWWQPGLLSWYTIGAAAGIALIAEIIEALSSAVGAAKTGGTKRAALGSVVGSIIGAIAGTPFLPPLGTILGAVAGAGLGAVVIERGMAGKTWKDSAVVGAGAATGRFVATVAKVGAAGAVFAVLAIGVLT